MKLKRSWAAWPKRFAGELNGVSGVASAGGAAVGFAGLSFFAGTAATALTGVGAVIFAGSFAYAAYRAVPLRKVGPEELVGVTIPIEDLANCSAAIPTLAIVGLSRAGKTTLRNRLALEPGTVGRTQAVTAYVAALQTTPPTYLAILDGGGERLAQQFKIAQLSHHLCIVVDHNSSDDDASIDDERIADHADFLRQIRHHLDEFRAPRKGWLRLIANKRDLWESVPEPDGDTYMRFLQDETDRWASGARASDVQLMPHSNERPGDIAGLMAQLKELAIRERGSQ